MFEGALSTQKHNLEGEMAESSKLPPAPCKGLPVPTGPGGAILEPVSNFVLQQPVGKLIFFIGALKLL